LFSASAPPRLAPPNPETFATLVCNLFYAFVEAIGLPPKTSNFYNRQVSKLLAKLGFNA
jgi:hypothetical protein